jgi:hypothetical protein
LSYTNAVPELNTEFERTDELVSLQYGNITLTMIEGSHQSDLCHICLGSIIYLNLQSQSRKQMYMFHKRVCLFSRHKV